MKEFTDSGKTFIRDILFFSSFFFFFFFFFFVLLILNLAEMDPDKIENISCDSISLVT